jgi:hypothetical protein
VAEDASLRTVAGYRTGQNKEEGRRERVRQRVQLGCTVTSMLFVLWVVLS